MKLLRGEAANVKDCFTRFSFQALLFSVAVLGLVASYQTRYPFIAPATVPVAFLLLVVTRIGTYKYGTANRNFGYDLHLHRVASLEGRTGSGWQERMRLIGW
ncbi:MAG: hypothetical protein ACE5GX_17345 [Thermoanaerobaculia bacterium]